jgi:hypothetical protein
MEMTGNQNKMAWHHTRQRNHLLDRIANDQLQNIEHEERDFAAAPANDERVINGPGVNEPCISLNRFPYDEYHTTDDNLDIMHEEMLVGAAETAEQIIRVYASNYIPKRTFRGPVFLSGHGLWVDWRENWALNRAIEKIMMCFEGQHTIYDIAEQVGLDYWTVREYVEKFRAKGFVTPFPIPSQSGTHVLVAFAGEDSGRHRGSTDAAARLRADLARRGRDRNDLRHDDRSLRRSGRGILRLQRDPVHTRPPVRCPRPLLSGSAAIKGGCGRTRHCRLPCHRPRIDRSSSDNITGDWRPEI